MRLGWYQLPAIWATVGAVRRSSWRWRPWRADRSPEEVVQERAAVPRALQHSYRQWAGSAPDTANLPVHTFSHWAMPLLARFVGHGPDSILRLLNHGVSLRILRPIPADARLRLRAGLQGIEINERRVRMHVRVQASLVDSDEACLVIDNYTVVPRGARQSGAGRVDARHDGYRQVGEWSATARDGLNFALLTGDFNPIHTVRWFARLSGFRGCVLQGFAQLAKTMEVLAQAGHELREVDAQFVKPMILPMANVGVHVAPLPGGQEHEFRVSDAQGHVYLRGRFRAS